MPHLSSNHSSSCITVTTTCHPDIQLWLTAAVSHFQKSWQGDIFNPGWGSDQSLLVWQWQPLLNAVHTNKLLQDQSHLCYVNTVVDDRHPWEHSAKADEPFKWSGMVPEPQHSVHTMPALALSPAIWLFQSVLTRLVQCQEREMEREEEEFKEFTLYALLRKLNIKCIFIQACERKQMHMKPCHYLKQFCVGTNFQSVHYFHANCK